MANKNPTLAEIAQNLGYDPANARLLPVKVEVAPYDDVPDHVMALASDMEIGTGPVTESGKPRMLKLSAWIAHAGPANKNGDAFLAEDLQAVAADGLFAPPYLGMVDFNHDFTPYGAWYSARYEFDPIANEYGLLAEGTMFAWRFEEMADKIIAEQVRNGSVAVSMACICQDIATRTSDVTGDTEFVLIKPVFLAVSILDVDPADPNGRANVSESEDSSHQERVQELNQAVLMQVSGLDLNKWAATAQANKIGMASQHITQEETMDFDTIIAKLTEVLGEQAEAIVAELRVTLADAAKVPVLEARVLELEGELETAMTSLEIATSDLDAATVALEAKDTELADLTTQFNELEVEHVELTEEIEEAERAQVRSERMELLPEVYITILEARDEESQERYIGRLVDMTEEEFEAELELMTASDSTSYADRTEREGKLSSTSGKAGRLAIDAFLN